MFRCWSYRCLRGWRDGVKVNDSFLGVMHEGHVGADKYYKLETIFAHAQHLTVYCCLKLSMLNSKRHQRAWSTLATREWFRNSAGFPDHSYQQHGTVTKLASSFARLNSIKLNLRCDSTSASSYYWTAAAATRASIPELWLAVSACCGSNGPDHTPPITPVSLVRAFCHRLSPFFRGMSCTLASS